LRDSSPKKGNSVIIYVVSSTSRSDPILKYLIHLLIDLFN